MNLHLPSDRVSIGISHKINQVQNVVSEKVQSLAAIGTASWNVISNYDYSSLWGSKQQSSSPEDKVESLRSFDDEVNFLSDEDEDNYVEPWDPRDIDEPIGTPQTPNICQ